MSATIQADELQSLRPYRRDHAFFQSATFLDSLADDDDEATSDLPEDVSGDTDIATFNQVSYIWKPPKLSDVLLGSSCQPIIECRRFGFIQSGTVAIRHRRPQTR